MNAGEREEEEWPRAAPDARRAERERRSGEGEGGDLTSGGRNRGSLEPRLSEYASGCSCYGRLQARTHVVTLSVYAIPSLPSCCASMPPHASPQLRQLNWNKMWPISM